MSVQAAQQRDPAVQHNERHGEASGDREHMYRRALQDSLLSRCTAAMAGWGCHLRFLWHTADKMVWVAVSFIALAVGGFAFFLQSIFEDRTQRQNVHCLALNVYYEARGEPRSGQYAVAEVTMNRVASRHYPNTVCAVVYQKQWDYLRRRYVGAFSWTELDRRPAPKGKEWRRAREVAETVYFQRHVPKLEGVVLYHADYIKPSWSRGKKPIARIGKHLFYR